MWWIAGLAIVALIAWAFYLLWNYMPFSTGYDRDDHLHESPRKTRYPAGTKIMCPDCGCHIATASRDIYGDELILSEPWGLPACSEMRCPNCRSPYFRRAAMPLHTERGWA